MKKILSCLLAVALVFSLMSVSVFADAVVGNGAAGGTNDDTLTDGVEKFDNQTSSGNITVNFTSPTNGSGEQTGSTMEDRYAIDITYSDLVIDLTNMKKASDGTQLTTKYIWDVNNHVYVEVNPANDEVLPSPTNNADPIVIDAFQVTNHSSKSIYYGTVLTNDLDTTMTMAISAGVSEEVTRATTDNGATNGDQETITVTPKTDWLTTINDLAASGVVNTANYKVGQIVITFSMAAIPTP